MKTKEELTALKAEVEALNKKLAELNEEELNEVTGGAHEITPAMRISDSEIIEKLFNGCESLKSAPELPATAGIPFGGITESKS